MGYVLSSQTIFKAIINKYSTITLPGSCVKEQGEVMELAVERNDLSRLIDKGMECRVEYAESKKMNAIIMDICKGPDTLLLTCKKKGGLR